LSAYTYFSANFSSGNIRSLNLLNLKQINLHHCKGATALIDNALHLAHTRKQKLIVLIQEPWINKNKIQGFNSQICNIFSLPKGKKTRSCIVATKNISVSLLPQFCDGDTTSVLLNTGSDGMNEDIILCSAYLPFDGIDSTPGRIISELTAFSTDSGDPLVLGCDSNAHHILWGISDINLRGYELAEFLATTDLEILNRGNEPTFVTRSRNEVLDVTFSTRNFVDRIEGWHVSPEESLSDHKEIRFGIKLSAGSETLFRNPRNTNWVILLFRTHYCVKVKVLQWVQILRHPKNMISIRFRGRRTRKNGFQGCELWVCPTSCVVRCTQFF